MENVDFLETGEKNLLRNLYNSISSILLRDLYNRYENKEKDLKAINIEKLRTLFSGFSLNFFTANDGRLVDTNEFLTHCLSLSTPTLLAKHLSGHKMLVKFRWSPHNVDSSKEHCVQYNFVERHEKADQEPEINCEMCQNTEFQSTCTIPLVGVKLNSRSGFLAAVLKFQKDNGYLISNSSIESLESDIGLKNTIIAAVNFCMGLNIKDYQLVTDYLLTGDDYPHHGKERRLQNVVSDLHESEGLEGSGITKIAPFKTEIRQVAVYLPPQTTPQRLLLYWNLYKNGLLPRLTRTDFRDPAKLNSLLEKYHDLPVMNGLRENGQYHQTVETLHNLDEYDRCEQMFTNDKINGYLPIFFRLREFGLIGNIDEFLLFLVSIPQDQIQAIYNKLTTITNVSFERRHKNNISSLRMSFRETLSEPCKEEIFKFISQPLLSQLETT
jgi:hypothetical protein